MPNNLQPNYSIFEIDMTAAGSQAITLEAEYLHFLTALDSGGVNLDATISLSLGTAVDDEMPLSINSYVTALANRWNVSWSAQPGVTAVLMFSRETRERGGVKIFSPPAKQLVSSALGNSLSQAAVTVAATETTLAAASATRQSVTIYNDDAAKVLYVGGAGVTTATGLPIQPGQFAEISKTTAEVVGIVATGTAVARVLVEG